MASIKDSYDLTSKYCNESRIFWLKMSLVPVPCQECRLFSNGRVLPESLDWLEDLTDKYPIWSRLNTMNTSGYNRHLPMSMLNFYHVEIRGRLWSLWGNLQKTNLPTCNNCTKKKSYLATTVMGLCAARVFHLNIWRPRLIDIILQCGKQYWKESLKKSSDSGKCYNLEDLDNECSLHGINFKIHLVTALQGELYSNPLDGKVNLGYALIRFFQQHQYGIVECFNRFLGFGFIEDTPGGYFMFDAQSKNYPLFPMKKYTPYILRTNHLQILLYCLVASIRSPYLHCPFALHGVNIELANPNECLEVMQDICTPRRGSKTILPKEYWITPSVSSKTSEHSLLINEVKIKELKKPIYRHQLLPSLAVGKIENCKVKPLVDNDYTAGESLSIKGDFIKIICSDTNIPLTEQEIEARKDHSFKTDLVSLITTGLAKYFK